MWFMPDADDSAAQNHIREVNANPLPVDLLVQLIGRLHNHPDCRPPSSLRRRPARSSSQAAGQEPRPWHPRHSRSPVRPAILIANFLLLEVQLTCQTVAFPSFLTSGVDNVAIPRGVDYG